MACTPNLTMAATILLVIFCQADATVVTHYDRLQKKLLEGYEGALPSVNNTPVNLGVELYLLQIHRLDGQSQTLVVSAQMSILWTDPHLMWRSDDYGGLEMTSSSPERVWLPPIGIINSAGQMRDDSWKKDSPLLIYGSGMVYWVVSSIFETSCELDMRVFPYDSQHCHITLGALVHSTDQMDMYTNGDTVQTDFLIRNKEWDLVSTSAKRVPRFSRQMANYKMPAVEFHLVLRRKPTFYVITLLIPSMVLSLLTPVVFTIPSDAGEKLSFSITIMLSFSVFLIILSDNIPRTSENVPLLGIYLSIVTAITGFSLVCTVIILNLNFANPLRPIPKWLYTLVVIGLGTAVCMKERNTPVRSSGNRIASDIEENGNAKRTNHKNSKMAPHEQHEDEQEMGDIGSLVGEMKSDLHEIVSQMNASKDENAIRDSWKLAADILDRFFLVIFLVVVVGTLFGMLFIYPETISDY